jgi:hypothetical protein
MTILDILLKAGGAAAGLVNLLNGIKVKYPDMAAEIDKVLDGLAQAVSPDNLISLAEALPKELANIAQGKLDPRRHPSDVA